MIKIFTRSFSTTIRRQHKLFDDKCLSICQITSLNSLNSNLMDEINDDDPKTSSKIKLSQIRLKGVKMELEYYDSSANTRFHQSQPTVLVLPNSEGKIKQFEHLIGSFVGLNYRVIALKFPGFGMSKLVEDDPVYECSINQRVCIVADFLSNFNSTGKASLDSIIGFSDNSLLIPFLNQRNLNVKYRSAILVNPVPPKFISSIKPTKLESYLAKFNATREIYKSKMVGKLLASLDSSQPMTQYDNELFNLYRSWSQVNERLIVTASINMTPILKRTLILLNTSSFYDPTIADLISQSFDPQRIQLLSQLDPYDTRIQQYIIDKSLELAKIID